MKAYRLDDFTSLNDLRLRDEDDPRPQRGEALVRIHAVSLNFRDIAMLRGRYPVSHRKGLIPTSDGAGEIIDSVGSVVGTHTGIHRYTIGQRRGIGIASGRALYVLGIDAEKNQVTVGEADQLLTNEFTAAGVNWIAYDNPTAAVKAKVRIRYRHQEAAATITPSENNRVKVLFDEPQRAITPGQATVFYDGDEVLGGGWIVKTGEAEGRRQST